jgi:hypothetical protein
MPGNRSPVGIRCNGEAALARLLLGSEQCAPNDRAWLEQRIGHRDWMPEIDRVRLAEIARDCGLEMVPKGRST